MRVLCSFFIAFACVLAGCEAGLGKCDMNAAKKVVYTTSGVPYYEGQALLHQSCGGSFCHAAGAKNEARFGVPHGVDLDVGTLSAMSTAAEVRALADGIERVRQAPGEIFDLVDSGEMPPGKVGERVLLPWRALDGTGKPTVNSQVADIHDSAGKEVLRNWLACDAPIVAGTTDAPPEAAKHGDIVAAANATIDPTFDSVYENVLADTCKACHNGTIFLDDQDVDLSSADTAFDTLVNAPAFAAGACDGKSQLVVPGDCEGSLLYQKLVGTGPAGAAPCGDAMPLGGAALSPVATDALCAWIDLGAKR